MPNVFILENHLTQNERWVKHLCSCLLGLSWAGYDKLTWWRWVIFVFPRWFVMVNDEKCYAARWKGFDQVCGSTDRTRLSLSTLNLLLDNQPTDNPPIRYRISRVDPHAAFSTKQADQKKEEVDCAIHWTIGGGELFRHVTALTELLEEVKRTYFHASCPLPPGGFTWESLLYPSMTANWDMPSKMRFFDFFCFPFIFFRMQACLSLLSHVIGVASPSFFQIGLVSCCLFLIACYESYLNNKLQVGLLSEGFRLEYPSTAYTCIDQQVRSSVQFHVNHPSFIRLSLFIVQAEGLLLKLQGSHNLPSGLQKRIQTLPLITKAIKREASEREALAFQRALFDKAGDALVGVVSKKR